MTKRTGKSPYDVLEVKEDADAGEIKRAYRKKAQKAHPDAGGSHEEMADINHAHDILSDPARKLLYDSTGQDQAKAFDEEVRSVILDAFATALNADAPNCVEFAKQKLQETRAGIEQKKRSALAAKTKFTAKRGKITVKSGVNLFHLLIDKELSTIEQALAVLEHGKKVCDAASKLLRDYKSTEQLFADLVNEYSLTIVMGNPK